MKDRIIKIGVLTAVFIVAVIVFSFITNQGNSDMTDEYSGNARYDHTSECR